MVVARQPRLDLGARVVGRAVVDDDELVDERVELVEHRRDRRLLVVRRDDGDASGAGRSTATTAPRSTAAAAAIAGVVGRRPAAWYHASVRAQPVGEGVARLPAQLVAGPVAATRRGPLSRRAGTGRTSTSTSPTSVAHRLGDARGSRPARRLRGCTCGSPRPASSASTCAAARSSTYTKDRSWLPSPSMRSGSPRMRPQQERGDHAVVAHARPERDAVAQDRVRPAEQGVRSRGRASRPRPSSSRRGGGRCSGRTAWSRRPSSPCVAA